MGNSNSRKQVYNEISTNSRTTGKQRQGTGGAIALYDDSQ